MGGWKWGIWAEKEVPAGLLLRVGSTKPCFPCPPAASSPSPTRTRATLHGPGLTESVSNRACGSW